MEKITELHTRFNILAIRASTIWQQYRFFILGGIGWALIVLNYPFGWQLPKYAEF